MERAHGLFGDARYQRLTSISVAHLCHLRQRPGYQQQRRVWTATHTTTVPIGDLRLFNQFLQLAAARHGQEFHPATLARELETVRWMGEAMSNREISTILGISAITLKQHVSKIYRKLDVQNRADAVAQGLRSGDDTE
jgi:DNA-binding CsgD family transcriptional regulator